MDSGQRGLDAAGLPTALGNAQGTQQRPGVFLGRWERPLHHHCGSKGLHRARAQSCRCSGGTTGPHPAAGAASPCLGTRKQKGSLVWRHNLCQSPLYLKSSARAQLGQEEDLKDPRELHSHFSLQQNWLNFSLSTQLSQALNACDEVTCQNSPARAQAPQVFAPIASLQRSCTPH